MQTNIVTVSNKWQVVIPKEVRKKVRIKPQDKVIISSRGTRRLIVDIVGESVVEKAHGFLRKYDKNETLFKELLEEKRKDLEYEDRRIK